VHQVPNSSRPASTIVGVGRTAAPRAFNPRPQHPTKQLWWRRGHSLTHSISKLDRTESNSDRRRTNAVMTSAVRVAFSSVKFWYAESNSDTRRTNAVMSELLSVYQNLTELKATLTEDERTPLWRLTSCSPREDSLACTCTARARALCNYRTCPIPLILRKQDLKWILTQTYAVRHNLIRST
jgi:hypothetical protein